MNSRKWLSVFAILFFSGINGISQDINVLIKEADRLEAIPNEKEALHKFKEALKLQPVNLYALSKCSELCSRIAAREPDVRSRNSYNEAAIIYAKTALKLYPNSDEANVAMGIAVGRTLLTKSGKEKIAMVKDIKVYADIAIKINPNNFKAWHILGKWNYEVSNLSMLERAATRIFYGGLPAASLKSSIAAYEKARALNPNFSLNYLELAKAYKKNNDKAKAVSLLKIMIPLPVQTEDDPRIKKEAVSLIKNWE
jgi:tetratricopeptide (TPR) repeat protein